MNFLRGLVRTVMYYIGWLAPRVYEALDTAFHAREIAAKAPLADAFVFLSGWYCSASAR